MMHHQTIEQIEAGRIIAIMRGDFGGREEEIVETLISGGIRAVEVPLNSPHAMGSIYALVKRFGSRIAIGAGTVLRPDEVEQAAGIGAQFIVSPNRNIRVIELTRKIGLVSLPGCFTPSEIIEAIEAGADGIKIFPANSLDPSYIKALLAPLDGVRLVPTGGVTPERAAEYFDAGAWAVGVGSELLDRDLWTGYDLEPLRQRALSFLASAGITHKEEMKEDEDPKKRLICIDTGTTNTRVWLIEDGQILARAHAEVGVRDTAREGTSNRLTRALSELIAEVRIKAPDGGPEPEMVIASGMITSSLGLAEVPHVAAPAGIHELAAGAEKQFFPRITDLPVLLVPGVRSGPPEVDEATVRLTDLMRGEETLCQGLVRLKTVQQPGLVLNLGSHWKAIRIDAEGRISGSLTSLSGEMIYATITQTILASSVPRQRTEQIDEHWIEAGMNEQRQTGLARALFCVRLHEQAKNGSPEQRLSFLIGAFISSELDSLIKNCDLKPDDLVVIAGTGALAEAWKFALNKHAIETRLLSAEETEAALLAGMCWVESVTGQLDLASK